MVRYLILGLLRDGVVRHGYALMKEYRDGSGIAVSAGNVYRELQSLVAQGWVRAAVNPPEADSRRLPYAITPAGIDAVDRWLSTSRDAALSQRVDELSLRAFLVA